jgi:hypothetical protein
MNRAQRRHVERQLNKLIKRDGDNCTICRAELQHNTRTFSGRDRWGRIVLTGECCARLITEPFAVGLYLSRGYDFFERKSDGQQPKRDPSAAEIAEALGVYQRAVSAADRRVGDTLRRGGFPGDIHTPINVLDNPWKKDDRAWFEQHPERSHRTRLLYPGEHDEFMEDTPPGHQYLVTVRQVSPGNRLKAGFYINNEMLPVPDDEEVAHVLFEIGSKREPIPASGEEFRALLNKYSPETEQ